MLGTIPGVSTIVPASMISFATRTPEVSIERTGVETRMSAPRRRSTSAATTASSSSISGRMRAPASPPFANVSEICPAWFEV